MKYAIPITIIFFIAIFAIANLQGWHERDADIYSTAIKENTPEKFILPAMYWIGRFLYIAIGDLAFPLYSFGLYISIILILLYTFSRNSLPLWILPVCFGMTSKWIPALCFFTRDLLMFFFAALFAFCVFETIKPDKETLHFIGCAGVINCMSLTKSFWTVFAGLLAIALIFKIKKRFLLTLPFFQSPQLSDTWGVIIHYRKLNPIQLLCFFANPLFGLSGLSLAHKQNWLHIAVIGFTIIAIGGMFAVGISLPLMLRYSLSLMPLHLVFIGMAFKDKGFLHFMGFAIAAKLISGFFFLDGLWRAFLGLFGF